MYMEREKCPSANQNKDNTKTTFRSPAILGRPNSSSKHAYQNKPVEQSIGFTQKVEISQAICIETVENTVCSAKKRGTCTQNFETKSNSIKKLDFSRPFQSRLDFATTAGSYRTALQVCTLPIFADDHRANTDSTECQLPATYSSNNRLWRNLLRHQSLAKSDTKTCTHSSPNDMDRPMLRSTCKRFPLFTIRHCSYRTTESFVGVFSSVR